MTGKYGVFSDTHFHNFTQFSKIDENKLNTRLVDTINAAKEALDAMIEAGCTVCYHCGDMFHVRGKLSPSVLNPVKALFEEYSDRLEFRILSGNHDLESAESEWLTSSSSSLATEQIKIINEIQVYDDEKVVMIPWVNKVSQLKTILEEAAKDCPNYTIFIHAPLNEVIMGIPDHGLEPQYLIDLGFEHVFCGHYHNHKNFSDKVFSVGSLTHQNFGDCEALAGYLIVSDGVVTHHETSAPKFTDISSLDELPVVSTKAKGNYTRIKIGEATDLEIQTWRANLLKEEALGVQVVATPKTEIVGRKTTTITGSETMQGSVTSWVQMGVDEDIQDEVNAQSLAIIGEIE